MRLPYPHLYVRHNTAGNNFKPNLKPDDDRGLSLELTELTGSTTEFGCCYPQGWAPDVEHLHNQALGAGKGADEAAEESKEIGSCVVLALWLDVCVGSRYDGGAAIATRGMMEVLLLQHVV
jgi:hypothetical protein